MPYFDAVFLMRVASEIKTPYDAVCFRPLICGMQYSDYLGSPLTYFWILDIFYIKYLSENTSASFDRVVVAQGLLC